jgi:hypothetical protein
MGLPSAFVKAKRVTPVVFRRAVPFAAPFAFGSKASEKNCVTIGAFVGNSPAGSGLNAEGEPGAVSGMLVSREPPGGSICTSVWMVAELVVAGFGGSAPGSSASSASTRLVVWLDARLVSTFCTCASASGLLVVTADAATMESAEVMLCAAPPVALMGALATISRMPSAVDCVSTD